MTSQRSFWDVDDVVEPIHVRDTVIGPATTDDVTEFCQRWHYSAVGGNMMWRWGLWLGPVLLGVVAYNLPTRRTCESVFGSEHFDKVWHMGRLAMAENAPKNSESRLIGGSLRAIQQDHPTTWAVLTYADTSVGHIGTVYQATNALYTGPGGMDHYFTDDLGKRRSTYLDAAHMTIQRATDMGWTRHEGGIKHRYLYVLGNRRERKRRLALLRLPTLPYPRPTEHEEGEMPSQDGIMGPKRGTIERGPSRVFSDPQPEPQTTDCKES